MRRDTVYTHESGFQLRLSVEKSKYQKIPKNKRQTDKRATIRHAVEGWN